MSNANYYRFEAELTAIIMAADPDTLRGALAGAVKRCSDANFNRALFDLLRSNAEPTSQFRKALDEVLGKSKSHGT